MKNIIAYTLCALTISSASFAEVKTTTTAIKAVYINNEETLFSFLNYGRHTPIVDKVAFFKSIPDLGNILTEISQADGGLAGDLLSILLKNDYYLSQAPLALLPADQTALVGPKAQLQLAVTISGHTVLSPQFASLGSQQAYLLIHEALHSLVSDYKNPMHDHQVKNITNYIRQNRGTYQKATLRPFIKKNFYRQLKEYSYGSFILDNSVALELRCDSLREELPETFELAEGYFGLQCNFANTDKVASYERYLAKKYKALGMTYVPYRFEPEDQPLRLLKEFTSHLPDLTKPIDSSSNSYHREACRENLGRQPYRAQALASAQEYSNIHNNAATFFASAKVSEQEKKLVAYYFTQDRASNMNADYHLNSISRLLERAAKREKDAVSEFNQGLQYNELCKKHFGKYF